MVQEKVESSTSSQADSISCRDERSKSFCCETLSLSKSSIRVCSNSSVRSSCNGDDDGSDTEENCDKEFDRLSRSLRDLQDDSDDLEAKIKFFFQRIEQDGTKAHKLASPRSIDSSIDEKISLPTQLDSNRQKENSFFSATMDNEIFASTLEETISSSENAQAILGKRKSKSSGNSISD